MKDFVGNKINVTRKLNFVLERVKNFVGKKENAGHQHFLLCPQYFQKLSFYGSLKSGLFDKKLKSGFIYGSQNLRLCRTK